MIKYNIIVCVWSISIEVAPPWFWYWTWIVCSSFVSRKFSIISNIVRFSPSLSSSSTTPTQLNLTVLSIDAALVSYFVVSRYIRTFSSNTLELCVDDDIMTFGFCPKQSLLPRYGRVVDKNVVFVPGIQSYSITRRLIEACVALLASQLRVYSTHHQCRVASDWCSN